MNFTKIFFACVVLAAGCTDQEAAPGSSTVAGAAEENAKEGSKQKAATLKPEEIAANNVIIDDNGSLRTLGAFKMAFGQTDPETGEKVFTREFGAPKIAGPTVVYVFKAIRAEDVDHLNQQGIKATENTAYLLPDGVDAFSDIDAFKEMQLIGPIDPTLSDVELGALFGLWAE